MSPLIVVSNRLPVTLKFHDGKYTYTPSSGGLVTALKAAKLSSYIWIGWPGVEITEEFQDTVRQQLMDDFSCVPVFLSREVANGFYNTFSNEVLWPLFHYFPEEINFDRKCWDMYVAANEAFAKEVLIHYETSDQAIWIHDYQLMLLPMLIRKQLVQAKIGFFLHIPFLSSEIYRVLPVRKDIIEGLLGSDLIGFHTFDYARHFQNSCSRVLDCIVQSDTVFHDRGQTKITVIPIGIDPNEFIDKINIPSTKEISFNLEQKFKNRVVLLGIDRLDYIKGIPNKLHAFQRLLEKNPKFAGIVSFLQIAIPSRTNVSEYQKLRSYVNEVAGEINGTFGQVDYLPVQIIHRSVNINELVALYRHCKICVISSIRDGMNLVAYEYISCHRHDAGRLILSEFAGSAQSLDGCYIINPWNIEEFSNTLEIAVDDAMRGRIFSNEKVCQYVLKNNSAFWCESFLKQLENSIPISIDPPLHEMAGTRSEIIEQDLILEMERIPNDVSILDTWVDNLCRHFSPRSIYILLENDFVPIELYPQKTSITQKCQTTPTSEYLNEIYDTIKIYETSVENLDIYRLNYNLVLDFSNVYQEFKNFEMPELFANIQKLASSYPISAICRKDYIILKSDFGMLQNRLTGILSVSKITEKYINLAIHGNAGNTTALYGPLKYFLKKSRHPTNE